MSTVVSVEELTELVAGIFVRHGMTPENADCVAEVVAAAERDGSTSHGLLRLAGYVSTLQSGWVDGKAVPVVSEVAPGLLATDAANGFAQPALRASAALLRKKARTQGIAALAIRSSHHFAALWPDVEPFAATGLIALAVANGRPRMAIWGGRKKILGTNPMAFACPRAGRPPLVWDQASSMIAQGEVLLAATRGQQLPPGISLDAEGIPTLDPNAVLQGGSMMPFGGHKGSSIAFMIEVLAAGLTGGRFGFEDNSAAYPGAQTSNAGEVVILIDPLHIEESHFFERIELLLEHIAASGAERLPSEHRYERRERALREGIAISDPNWTKLHDLLA